ncbi:S8 family serine peptidase [Streptomyces sp. ActVer]|uniref:S8 family peptidase n=1 Tax=Streptomyces sp. ActVer TaxID=3014558 RepID=UPI0022B4A364|nr:S8 family serine peptidase [Streptomyces sp. ActVer]MCZ4507640.1 S8 family serine peptidase [Streptomyces sp. ActVer]
MRRHHALWAVAGAAGLLAGAVTPATAGPGDPVTKSDATTRTGAGTGAETRAGTTQTVTLITGDTVSLTAGPDGKHAVDVRRGKGREAATFLSTERDGEISVLPADALPLVQAGRLDPALFNITQLVKQGYTDSTTGTTPLIATYTKGSATPDGARRTLALPGIDGAALSARKSTAFWADIAPALGTGPTTKAARQLGDGIKKIWLDAKVKVSLDTSVPQIGAPEVWQSGYDGKGVKVAVLDTGVDTGHPDLAGKLAETKSFVPTEAVQDGHGHGTHVASTIAGSGAASDGRLKGVAPGAELLVGKVLANDGRGQTSWILDGMDWAARSGAKIVSMSLGGDASGPSDVLSETVDELSASTGALFVIAAGNSGPSEQTLGTPGIADSALTVGAVDKSDKLASFSSRGPRLGDSAIKPEITAPGVGIAAARALGTNMPGSTPVGDSYTRVSGTSMATPHVSGTAALVAQAHPDWTGQQIKQALATTAETSPDASVFEQGDGRVDAVRAVGQGVFATPALSFGQYEADGAEAASKDITYTNTTDKAVELKLASSLTEAALGADVVTVPAKGTATVAVTVDPAEETEGRYTGHVTASADGVRVTTAVGFEKLPKTYDLKVSLVNRSGQPSTSASLFVLQELNGAYPDTHGFLGRGYTFKVPAGTYSMATWIPERDAAGLEVATSVVGDPEIKVDKDTEVVFDARKAVEIKPRTKENSEFQSFSTSWHREGPGTAFGATYAQNWWTDRVYVAPTEKVTEGLFEFAPKFRLYEKELTASVSSPEKYALPLDYSQSESLPVKINGKRTVRAVDAGSGTAADFQGLDVKGKVAVVRLAAGKTADEAVANATKAGAGYVIAYQEKPGYWISWVDSTTIPLMVATGEDGAKLGALLKSGKKVTLKLDGTAVSPYVYNVMFPQTGAISKNQTYALNSSTTVKQKVRYHGSREGDVGRDAVYRYRPWQGAAIETSQYVPLGTTRTEYYNVDPDTRIWNTVSPNWQTNRGQWNDLRTFDKAGKAPSEEWLRQVVRPATSERYGLSQRTGDKLALRVPELSDATPGHYASVDGAQDTAKGTLYADGKLVGNSVLGGYGTFDVPATKASYRFVLDAQRKAGWATYSTSTHTEWSFASAHTNQQTALPLLSVDYGLDGLDLLNRAEAKRKSKLELSVRDQKSGITARELKAWVSYDDGASWKTVKVRDGKAELKHPKGAEFVSLRVRAADREGNTVDQTVLRAFGLK